MKTVDELGALVKSKYSQYGNMDDAEVGRLIRAKYPNKYVEYSLDPDPMFDQIGEILQKYHPDRGVFTSFWQRRKSAGRGRLLTVLNDEIHLAVEAIKLQGEATLVKVRHELEVVLSRNHAIVTELATRQGMTVETYQQALLMQLEIDKKIALRDHKSDLRMKEAERLADIEVSKHQRMRVLEAEMKEREAALDRMMHEYKTTHNLRMYQRLQSELSKTMKVYYEMKDNATTPYDKAEVKRLKNEMNTYSRKIKELGELL
ncbi:MAG: hypothetical protein AB1757_06885 [Acidobacteriota bacterium]